MAVETKLLCAAGAELHGRYRLQRCALLPPSVCHQPHSGGAERNTEGTYTGSTGTLLPHQGNMEYYLTESPTFFLTPTPTKIISGTEVYLMLTQF